MAALAKWALALLTKLYMYAGSRRGMGAHLLGVTANHISVKNPRPTADMWDPRNAFLFFFPPSLSLSIPPYLIL